MPSAITFPLLTSINNGVSLSFNSQLYSTATIYDKFTFQGQSTGNAEVYPRLDMLPGLREWLGDRVVHSLSETTFSISNKTFEETISVRREDLEDDRYGILTRAAEALGENAGRLPDLLIASLMLAGDTAPTFDGQNFFDTAHPNPNRDGKTMGTVANKAVVTGGGEQGPAWFLIDNSRVLKPFIFQRRRPFQVIPKFSLTDPEAFFNNEFMWGVDGRCNAGYGLWQLCFMSTQPLTHDNVVAARTAMLSIRRPDGAPMGIKPNLLVAPSVLYPTAKALAENEFQPTTVSATSLVPNQVRGMFAALENEWLN
jgi:phage major head subunit gpT-like protein